MAATLWSAPTQPFQTTLSGSLGTTDNTIALTSVTGLQAPGVLILERQDGQGNNTFSRMEIVSFTGISGITVTGVTRGVAGTTAISHNSGALAESQLNVTHWTDLISFLTAEHLLNGTNKVFSHARSIQVTGISGLSGLKGNVVFVPKSNISIYPVSGASGYPFIKMDMSRSTLPPFVIADSLGVGQNIPPLIIVKDDTVLRSVSIAISSPASSASMIIDINRNFTSIFTDQNTRLTISPGGTYASTASIGAPNLVKGDILSLDIDVSQ